MLCFFAIQAFSFLILSPVLILIHAIMFSCGCYNVLLCGKAKSVFPLSSMLLTDLRDQCAQVVEIKRRDNKVLQRDHTE